MPADREAEVEAVARILRNGLPHDGSDADYAVDNDAREIIEALDRVRGPQGVAHAVEAIRTGGLSERKTVPRGEDLDDLRYPLTATQIAEARSPQGEKVEAVARAIQDLRMDRVSAIEAAKAVLEALDRVRGPQGEDHKTNIEAEKESDG